MQRFILSATLAALLAAGAARAGDAPKAAPADPAALAHRLWAVSSLVLEKHIDPCTRQEMVLGGLRAALKAAKATLPAGLGARVSEVTREDQAVRLFEELLPRGEKAPPADALEKAMLEGLLSAVPGQPALMPPKYRRVAEQVAANRYVGIGIQIGINAEEKRPYLVTPFPKGPANRAGMRPDDLFLSVDGKDTKGVPLTTVVDWLRGEEGSQVTVVVRQPGEKEERALRMTRGVVPFDTVLGFARAGEDGWSYRPDPAVPVGYARVSSVKSSTVHELRKLEQRLQADGVRAVVLDFRSAGGEGNLHDVRLAADALLDGGTLWRSRGRDGKTEEFKADRECLFRGMPVVALVDGGIKDAGFGALLAALQDNGRAVLVGEPTQAEGYVSTLVEVPGTADSFPLRTARLERAASGRGWPVEPDHAVPLRSDAVKAAVQGWLSQKEVTRRTPDGDKPPRDPQLAKAMELLKATLAAQGKPARTGAG
jgi:carboxyl-terminal processing protease